MCGIAGVLGSGTVLGGAGLSQTAGVMSRAIAHRGPDDDGTWLDPDAEVCLVHRRLAVIDLSAQGHQPMVSHAGRWVISYNGEIYNFRQLRHDLSAEGQRFRGGSDTEVLLAAVEAWGVRRALERVDGMFALALWDAETRNLWLARDRMGEKPLYYAQAPPGARFGPTGGFAFASELRALEAVPGLTAGIDPRSLAQYLRYGFIPAPHAILAGVRKLPAGRLLRRGPDGRVLVEPYWQLGEVARRGRTRARVDVSLIDRVDQVLTGSVADRMVADVPLGVFLSGGVDSSLIAALAQRSSTTPVRTFTVGFDHPGSDESGAAAAVAAHLGTDHQSIQLPTSRALELAPTAAAAYDEPFADPSGLPTLLLAAEVRRHVTVALSGDGGDELFAGYRRYRAATGVLAQVMRLPVSVRRGAAGTLDALDHDQWDRVLHRVGTFVPQIARAGDVATRVEKLARVLRSADAGQAYQALSTLGLPAGLAPGLPVAAGAGSAASRGLGALEAMLLADGMVTLPDDMLVKVDRASMQVALEVRVPLLAREVVEQAWSLPAAALTRAGTGKWVLREVLARYVPRPLTDRPKQGFDPPLAGWLRGPLRDWSHDLLAGDRLCDQGVLDPVVVRRVLAEHESGRRNHDYALWALLSLQSWWDGRPGLTVAW
ncbi:MAG: asparagine synthase (glutamine-hydrolyzing) [Actinomycetes bacterium]